MKSEEKSAKEQISPEESDNT